MFSLLVFWELLFFFFLVSPGKYIVYIIKRTRYMFVVKVTHCTKNHINSKSFKKQQVQVHTSHFLFRCSSNLWIAVSNFKVMLAISGLTCNIVSVLILCNTYWKLYESQSKLYGRSLITDLSIFQEVISKPLKRHQNVCNF